MGNKIIVKADILFRLYGAEIVYTTCKVQGDPINEKTVTDRFIRDHKILEAGKKKLTFVSYIEKEKIGI